GARCRVRERKFDMALTTPVTSRTAPCACVYIDVHPFSYPWFAGIARYTARLALALSAELPVRFFDEGQELFPHGLKWSQDQDLEDWGRQVWQGQRRPLGTPPVDSVGLFSTPRPRQRNFPREVSILFDLCPMVVPWAFPKGTRDGFGKFLTETLPAS